VSLNTIIRAAITPIVPECVPDQYTGAATEYCTFNYTELPDAFGDEMPGAIRYLVQLHYFCPYIGKNGSYFNPYTKKKQLKNALLNAGFTYPSVTNASDADGQHYALECEYSDGDV
jgi:hypothetical protein